MRNRILELLVCGAVVAGAAGIVGVIGFMGWAWHAANPTDYAGYQPGTRAYEAREFWYSVPEVMAGGEWTCDWEVLLPFSESEGTP